MFKILKKKVLNPTVTLMEIDAPLIAKKAEPGQFIILRPDVWDDESTITANELKEAIAARDVYLATVKQRYLEYKASKTATANTTAAPAAGGFKF